MESFRAKTANLIKERYPVLIIFGLLFVIYIPYLSGKFVVVGPGGARSGVWDFILGPHYAWIDFFKNMGEFMGGMPQYGFFNPFELFFRLIHFTDFRYAEYLLGFIYGSIALLGAYYLFRQIKFAKWVALLGAVIFALNGYTFMIDINISQGFGCLLCFPFLFLIALQEFQGSWRKILFALLLGFEAISIHPQYIGWQLVIITLYIVYVKGWRLLKPFLASTLGGAILMLPQLLLTQISFIGDVQRLTINPFATSLPGNPLRFLPQLFDPFSPLAQLGYLTPYYYTALIGTLIFIFFLPTLCRKWKELPRTIKFSAILALFFFLASFQGNPLQTYFLAKIPFFNQILSRNPYRYVYFYFFFLSFIVTYCLQNYLTEKERLIKFSKFLLVIGITGTIGYILSSIVYKIGGERIYEFLKNQFISDRLPNVRGGYPPEYYFNLLKMYYTSYFSENTLLTWSGLLSALPFISFLVWGIAVVKNKIKEPLKYLPHFIVVQVILTGFIFSAVLAQNARKTTDTVFDKKENNIALVIKEKADWRNSYIISYGNFAGELYLRNLYKDSYDIGNWLLLNQYDKYLSYDSIPRIQNDTNPFQLLRDRLLATYIGYQLTDLYPLKGEFPDNKKTDPLILNNLAFDKDILNPPKMETNLNDKIGILRNIGVRYVVSQYKFKGPEFKLAEELSIGQPSELLPDYTATLYLYELNNPGKIIFVPPKIQLAKFDSIDLLDFQKVRGIYDQLNKKDTSTIELKDLPTNSAAAASQNTGNSKINLEKMDNDIIKFAADFTEDTYVIINVYYYPGWRAFVDNTETVPGRANLNFLTVKVPAGKHEVEFRFDIYKMVIDSL